MTTTPISGAADLPEALRSIQRFEVVDCIDDKHVPAVIPNPHGPWVRYEDHIVALAAGQATAAQAVVPANMRLCYSCGHPADAHPWVNDQRGGKRRGDCPAAPAQPAAQQGGDYAELPVPNYPKSGGFPGTFAEAQMRAFADATHTLRASRGQAPAAAQADSVQDDAARLDWLEQNLFHREMDEWDIKFGGRGDQNMWVMFAPKGVQGSARRIIDATRKQGGAT